MSGFELIRTVIYGIFCHNDVDLEHMNSSDPAVVAGVVHMGAANYLRFLMYNRSCSQQGVSVAMAKKLSRDDILKAEARCDHGFTGNESVL